MRNEPERIWTSTKVYEIYISKGATDTSRVCFLYSLEEKLGKNFDATINSQNGMKQTHALASYLAQANGSDEDNNEFKFPRLKQKEIKSVAQKTFPEYL